MIRILVMSDSHGSVENVNWALQRNPTVDWIFHLGDGAGEQMLLRSGKAASACVAGNCDWYSNAPDELKLEIGGARFLLTHGHRYSVKMRLDTLAYAAEAAGAKIALFGHTHRQVNIDAGGVMLVNPGSIRNGYYALLTVENGEINVILRNLMD